MPVAQDTTKNRQVNEIRAQIDTLRSEIADVSKPLTMDELTKKTDALKVLEQRAALTAGFTPQRELAAQIEDSAGDAADPDNPVQVRRVPTPAGATAADAAAAAAEAARLEDGIVVRNVTTRIESFRKKMLRHFGATDVYLRALTDARVWNRLNAEQRKVMDEAKALTKIITADSDSGDVRTIIGDATTGGDYLLPLQQAADIFRVQNNVQRGIMQDAARYTVNGRTLRIPYVVQTDGNLNRPIAGIANVTIVGEGVAKPVREPVFAQRLLTVYKWAAISKIADETIADDMTGELQQTVTDIVGSQFMNAMNEKMTIDGTGTGEPLGAFNAANASLLLVNRTTAGTVTVDDIFKMYERHTHGPRSKWMISRRVLSKILALQLGGNNLVTFLPNLRDTPPMTLLGLPIEVSDLLPTLGTQSDVVLCNGEFYAMALRTQLTVESSIHVEFVNDVTTYRFFARGGGVPIPDGTYAYKSVATVKTDPHSPFVALN